MVHQKPRWAIKLCLALEDAGQTDRKRLAERLGVSTRTISHWMAGEREPPYDALIQLRDITGVSLDWILAGKGNPLIDN